MNYTDEFHTAMQIERELETEDLVMLNQLRKAQRSNRLWTFTILGELPYVAKPSLFKPGATIATGR
jgi:hypothetical protein